MDWERTKTILILAFLLLNIGFLFQLWIIPNYFDSSMTVSPGEVEAKLAELRSRNINVTAEVPRQLARLRLLVLNSLEPNNAEIVAALLGPESAHVASVPNQAPGHRRYESPVGEVTIYSDGRIAFTAAPPGGVPELSASNARYQADTFLDSTLGKPSDSRVGRVKATGDGTWIVEYYQVWRNRDLGISRITILVDSSGVRQMDYYWVKVAGFTGENIVTIPAAGALIVAADNMPSGSTITNIYISWYSPPILAEQWRVPPVWVVEISNGTRYFINAFTGDLEGREEFQQENPARR